MPVLLEEKRIFFSSAEKEAPEIAVVARNCSIVYCFEGRPGGAAKAGAAATASARPARPNRRRDFMAILLSRRSTDLITGQCRSGAELAQMMVNVLVHHHAPFLPLEPAEKGVGL